MLDVDVYSGMKTHFLTLEVDSSSPDQLHQIILTKLQQLGEPLRWAIVSVDNDCQRIQVEAVITTSTEFLIPSSSITTV